MELPQISEKSVVDSNNESNLQSEVSLSTEESHTNSKNLQRRSSSGFEFLNSKKSNEDYSKRRKSISVILLGKKVSKSKHEKEIRQEKYQRKSSEDSDLENCSPQIVEESQITQEINKKKRRSSWVTKMDRRRRKGLPVLTSDNEYNEKVPHVNDIFVRQKRHSWWNIFIPDNLKNRSRRSSQDVGVLGSQEKELQYKRSKSRSVDHGLAAPFDLDSLKSKVESRFESIDKLASKGPSVPTIRYTVGDRDTLTSVAARFDTTPSELTKLNKLGSSFIYSGQQLSVPVKQKSKQDESDNESVDQKNIIDEIPKDENDILDNLRIQAPGRDERIANDEDQLIVQRFLKLNVRHITDGQGVVGGVLLVTPNAVMFDPNVSDPLVIEHGPESYGVIAPMEFIVNTAIFNDIAHMRVENCEKKCTSEKHEVYHPKTVLLCETSSPGKDSLLIKDEVFPELRAGSSVDQESNCSNDRDGDAFPKAFDRDLVTPVEKSFSEICENVIPSCHSDAIKNIDEKVDKGTEERRKSLLDQHWAIPNKDRSDDDAENNGDEQKFAAEEQSISNKSCHDSGIDIRETIPQIQTKKTYSDADIVLSSDFVPPLTIAPATITTETKSQSVSSYDDSDNRKKTSSVSFSIEENENSNERNQEIKKNKMLKRLSYPLSWVEGLTGEQNKHETESAPATSDSNQSVFSKVFSSSPITLVSEFGGTLFKTPSEESSGGGSQSPIPTHHPLSHDSNNSVFSANSAGRSSIGTFIRSHQSSESSNSSHTSKNKKESGPKLDYRSMVSIDDMPALFVSFDKLIPRPARACQDPPMYIRLRMGRKIGKNSTLPNNVMSYGKNKLRPEYWFSIPKNKVDELYRFINSWVPQIYGDLDEDELKVRGYELIQNDTEWSTQRASSKDGTDIGEELGEYTRESWELLKAPFVKTFNIIKTQAGSADFEGLEVLSMNKEDYRNSAFITSASFDQDFPIPDLIGKTEILSEDHREKLCSHLPARAEGYSWSLVFSTSQHGFSLNSLYRKMNKLESPILIVIEDTEKNVFGALTSCSLHVSDHFYGTGESLLFKFNPNFKVFHWSGENLYFIKGNPESLAIGAGDGKFGLWLDGDLNQGRSQSCSTYANEPLAPEEDFVIKTLECWAFV